MTIRNAELIRAVLDGKTLQYRQRRAAMWITYSNPQCALEDLISQNLTSFEFRVKPGEVVRYRALFDSHIRFISHQNTGYDTVEEVKKLFKHGLAGVEKITYDPDTGHVIGLELVE